MRLFGKLIRLVFQFVELAFVLSVEVCANVAWTFPIVFGIISGWHGVIWGLLLAITICVLHQMVGIVLNILLEEPNA